MSDARKCKLNIRKYGCTRVEAGYGGDGSWRYDNDIGALMHTQEFMTVVRSTVGRQSVSGFGPPIQFSSLVVMESYIAGYCSAIQTRELSYTGIYRQWALRYLLGRVLLGGCP